MSSAGLKPATRGPDFGVARVFHAAVADWVIATDLTTGVTIATLAA
jgi:hypothetical protein